MVSRRVVTTISSTWWHGDLRARSYGRQLVPATTTQRCVGGTNCFSSKFALNALSGRVTIATEWQHPSILRPGIKLTDCVSKSITLQEEYSFNPSIIPA